MRRPIFFIWIFGFKVERKNGSGFRSLKAFTLIELLVVVAIIAVLIAILLPTLGSARKKAREVECASQIKQVGMGLVMYAGEFNGFGPYNRRDQSPLPDASWFYFHNAAWSYMEKVQFGLLYPYINEPGYSWNCAEILKCKEDAWGRVSAYSFGECTSYWMNPETGNNAISKKQLDTLEPVRCVVMDINPTWIQIVSTDNHESRGANTLRADGHVVWVREDRFARSGTCNNWPWKIFDTMQ